MWLLKRRGYWYRPEAAGYTANISEAGRFTDEEAASHCTAEGVTKHQAPIITDIKIPAQPWKAMNVAPTEDDGDQALVYWSYVYPGDTAVTGGYITATWTGEEWEADDNDTAPDTMKCWCPISILPTPPETLTGAPLPC